MISLDTLYLSAEYQPLIYSANLQVYGYEALSRFSDHNGVSTPPNVIFEQLHSQHKLLAKVESTAKKLQIQYSDPSLPLFVNLDPHAVENQWQQVLDILCMRSNVTVEIIENTCINDARLSSQLAAQLKSRDIKVALDDIGAPHSMLSLDLINQVHTLKFDIEWLKQSNSKNHQHLFKALLQFAKASNKLTVLEGIETDKQLALARELGVDLLQGFLFKSQFTHSPKSKLLL